MKVCHLVDFTHSFSLTPCRLTVSMDTGSCAANNSRVFRKGDGFPGALLWGRDSSAQLTAHSSWSRVPRGHRGFWGRQEAAAWCPQSLQPSPSPLPRGLGTFPDPSNTACPNSVGCFSPSLPLSRSPPGSTPAVLKTFWRSDITPLRTSK